jgi:hypothetical protein
MNCPSCGYVLEGVRVDICPACGKPMPNEPASASGGARFSVGSMPSEVAPLPPSVSSPTTSQWMKPSLPPAPVKPRPSRNRRRLASIIAFIVILGACAGYGYLTFVVHGGPKPTSATNIPDTNALFSDPLTSDINGWSVIDSHCFFQDNTYHIKDSVVCFAPYTHSVSDASITVQAKQVAGPLTQLYGIIFRGSNRLAGSTDGNWYEFAIDSDRQWGFFKSINGTGSIIVDETTSTAINGDRDATNTLTVQAEGSHFVFFINGTQVGEADDSTFATGAVGLFADSNTEVAYTNFEITAA